MKSYTTDELATVLANHAKWLRGEAGCVRANLTGADLRDAYLAGANLTGADLRDANLAGANLADANLAGADLRDAYLAGAYLVDAYLAGANLAGAYLTGAYLADAYLAGAYLAGAYLVDANLVDANLAGAYLAGAYLVDANLTGANLVDAYLAGANLAGADLTDADLTPIRSDLFAVLDSAPNEVAGLLAALEAGKIDGSTYEGECACLVGTIANVRHCTYRDLGALKPDSRRPAERWFLAIRPGDAPATSHVARITAEWIREWQAAYAAKGGA